MDNFVYNPNQEGQLDFLQPIGLDHRHVIDVNVWYTSKQISDFCGGRPNPDGITNAFNDRGDFGRTLKNSPLLKLIKQDRTGKKLYNGLLVELYLSFKNRSIGCPESLGTENDGPTEECNQQDPNLVIPDLSKHDERKPEIRVGAEDLEKFIYQAREQGIDEPTWNELVRIASDYYGEKVKVDLLRGPLIRTQDKTPLYGLSKAEVIDLCKKKVEQAKPQPDELPDEPPDENQVVNDEQPDEPENLVRSNPVLSADLQSREDVRRSAMTRFNEGAAIDTLDSIKGLFWAQWNDSQWLTTKQVADFLGVTTRAVDFNYQRNKQEFLDAGEVQTLKSADLKAFKQLTKSDLVSSGNLHPYTPRSNIYSPQGVLRMSWISESSVSLQVRNASIALISKIPEMIEKAVENSRNESLDRVPKEDISHAIIVDSLSDIRQNTGCLPHIAEDIRDIKQLAETGFIMKERILSNCGERRIVDALHEVGLPHITNTESDKPVWFEWNPKKETKVERNIIYFIFVDLYRTGSLTHLFSIGESGNGSQRLSMSHERIRFLIDRGFYFKVFYWPLEDAAYDHKQTRRQSLEGPLQQRLRSVWETQWDEERRKKEREGLY